jgi:hypothetical protein
MYPDSRNRFIFHVLDVAAYPVVANGANFIVIENAKPQSVAAAKERVACQTRKSRKSN